jgi:hypothetical protein
MRHGVGQQPGPPRLASKFFACSEEVSTESDSEEENSELNTDNKTNLVRMQNRLRCAQELYKAYKLIKAELCW